MKGKEEQGAVCGNNWREQMPYAYWLHRVSKSNSARLWKVTEQVGEAKEIYKGKLPLCEPFLKTEQWLALKESRKCWDIQGEWEKLQEKGIRFIPFFHPDYPERLKHIPDPPWAVYLKGELPKPDIKTVAVVGARQCSEYGRLAAANLGKRLGERGIPVISGMARGVDGISQLAALKQGGQSLGILGCGVDVCYPKENQALYERLERGGGILSEYPPGTQPLPILFPPRNRLISGFCDVLVVVEAKEHSGTLITVDMALEQGKEVLVIPGRITDALSSGCNRLIKQGAGVLTSMEDILQALHMEEGEKQERVKQERQTELQPEEKGLVEVLDFMPKGIEQIWTEYGKERISLSGLMQELLSLCLKGKAKQMGGNYVKQ